MGYESQKNALLTSSLYHITSHMYLRTWHDVIFSPGTNRCVSSASSSKNAPGTVSYFTTATVPYYRNSFFFSNNHIITNTIKGRC